MISGSLRKQAQASLWTRPISGPRRRRWNACSTTRVSERRWGHVAEHSSSNGHRGIVLRGESRRCARLPSMSEDLTLTVRVPIEVRVSADGGSHGVEGGRAKLVARSDPEKPVPGMRMEHPRPDGLLPRLVVDRLARRATGCSAAFPGDFVGLF